MPADIIAFAKDWDDTPTSNHHVLRELAKTRRVLWLNSVATRTPSLSSGRDLRRIVRKAREFARPPENVENNLWVSTPLVLPLPHSRTVGRLNGRIVRATIRRLRRRLGLRDFQLWTFLPSVAGYVGTLGESLAVYYCVDEWSMFSYIERDRMVATERALLARVDCVFATGDALAEEKRRINPETHTAPHGVDHDLFSRALDPATPIPGDVASLPGPVIGFFGTLQDWVDLELIAGLARLRPEWSIVLIGRTLVDTSAVAGLGNVHVLGPRPQDQLPGYCKGFAAGLIPYRVSEQLPYRNPLKLREYLAAGLAVVSTPVPEVHKYGRWCAVAEDSQGFADALDAAVGADSPDLRRERSDAMRSETWAARVASIARTVDEVAGRSPRHSTTAMPT
jgi:glycosyltransferase involved in cell wall biosynthesis